MNNCEIHLLTNISKTKASIFSTNEFIFKKLGLFGLDIKKLYIYRLI